MTHPSGHNEDTSASAEQQGDDAVDFHIGQHLARTSGQGGGDVVAAERLRALVPVLSTVGRAKELVREALGNSAR